MNKMDMAEWLAQARIAAQRGDLTMLTAAFNELDNGGAFKTLDQFTEYASPEEILDAKRKAEQVRKDPAEWGDLSGYAALPGGTGNAGKSFYASFMDGLNS